MNIDELDEILENARKDTSLLASIDIDLLLENIDHNDLENKTLDSIANENQRVLENLSLKKDTIKSYFDKLAGFTYINDLYQIHKGKYIRWINPKNQLTNGGIVVDILFNNNGTNIMVRNSIHKIIQIKYDTNTIFQKLTAHEQLLLMAYNYV